MEESKKGIGIGIISGDGLVSLKWMKHYSAIRITPIGAGWQYITVEGLSYGPARNEVVRKAKERGCKWLFFLDDDVFLPNNALSKLLKQDKDIITGIYWTKTKESNPVLFKKLGEGPYYDFPLDSVVEVEGAGMGCCLINMRVFDAFDKAGINYFVEQGIHVDKNGKVHNLKAPGEDHWFFLKAKELGFKVFADTSLLCDHYDHKTKKMYPQPDVVQEICKKRLIQEGRSDIIEDYDKRKGLDPDKKTIVFYNDGPFFAGDEIYRRAIGGSESGLIDVAKLLATDYNVHVCCRNDRPGVYDNVYYHPIEQLDNVLKQTKPEYFISSRCPDVFKRDLKKMFGVKFNILWGSDKSDSVAWKDLEEVYDNIDRIVLLSNWHKNDIRKKFKFVKAKKVKNISYSVDPKLYECGVQKNKFKLIYCSTPFRGLDVALKMFPKIKKEIPEAELHIFSSIKIYGDNFMDNKFEDLYTIARRTNGVYYRGILKRPELAFEQKSSGLLFYPNTFEETFCKVVAECQVAGTPTITSDNGALSETLREGCGILVKGNPYSKEYQKTFISETIKLLKSKQKWNRMSKKCLTVDFSEEKIRKDWKKLLRGLK